MAGLARGGEIGHYFTYDRYKLESVPREACGEHDIRVLGVLVAVGVAGAIFKMPITNPSNYRSDTHFNDWLKARNADGNCCSDILAMNCLNLAAIATAVWNRRRKARAAMRHFPRLWRSASSAMARAEP